MANLLPVAKVSDLKPGEMKRVTVDKLRILLANMNGTFYALKDECGHQKVALSKGKLEGYVVECPLHFACFDVRSGKLLSGPDFGRVQLPGMDQLGPEAMAAMQRLGEIIGDVESEDVPAYEVQVQGDTVLLSL